MSKQINNDQFSVLRIIKKSPESSQRKLAKNLGFSLGKLNYCMKSLKDRGMIKLKYFRKNPNKLCYLHLLTSKGITAKTKITTSLMKNSMKQYDELKKELKDEK